jgi:hypothetical protein
MDRFRSSMAPAMTSSFLNSRANAAQVISPASIRRSSRSLGPKEGIHTS